jgi:hypothetical protein
MADLEVEIGEEGRSYSETLDAAQNVLQDAEKRLTSLISDRT